MPLILMLHVIGIGVLLGRVRMRPWLLLGIFFYFVSAYLGLGYYMSNHHETFELVMPVDDDYYHLQREPAAPTDAPPSLPSEEERELESELERRVRELSRDPANPGSDLPLDLD